MKITLINPYKYIQAFGLRTISACLKREGHDVQTIFLMNDYSKRYRSKVLEQVVELSEGSDLIGISLMTNYFNNAVQITEMLKNSLEVPVMWGGVHPTIRPEECLHHADIVCVGEGEATLSEVIHTMKEGKFLHGVEGVWFKENGRVIKNAMRPLTQNLDSLPIPDYNYNDHYILNGGRIRRMNEGLLNKYTHYSYVTMATRGCPYICTYCCNNFFNRMHTDRKMVRKRGVDNIIKELVDIKRSMLFVTNMIFEDDCFFIYSDDEMQRFCELYKKEIGLPLLVPGIAPLMFSRKKLLMLVDAGLRWVRMGIQTGSSRTKKFYKRNYSNQQVEGIIKVINEFKDKVMVPSYDIILDNPWETDDDLIETLAFLSKLPTPYKLNLFSLTFYPETELYEMAKKDGIITDDMRDVYSKCIDGPKKTYINRLFFLLNDYAQVNARITTRMIYFLTSTRLRRFGLNWLLYGVMKLRITFSLKRLWWLRYYSQKAMEDIRNGDWARIKVYTGITSWKRKKNIQKI